MPRIVVRLNPDRTLPGTLQLENNNGTVVSGPFPVLGRADDDHRNPTRDPLQPYGDTPAGQWRVSGWRPTGIGTTYSARSFGPHGALTMEGLGGDALQAAANGRTGIYIHAGTEGTNGPGSLRPTAGCLRLSNNNMLRLMTALTQLATEEGPPRVASTIDDRDILVDVQTDAGNPDTDLADPPGPPSTWEGFPTGQSLPLPGDTRAQARRALQQAMRQGPGGATAAAAARALERALQQAHGNAMNDRRNLQQMAVQQLQLDRRLQAELQLTRRVDDRQQREQREANRQQVEQRQMDQREVTRQQNVQQDALDRVEQQQAVVQRVEQQQQREQERVQRERQQRQREQQEQQQRREQERVQREQERQQRERQEQQQQREQERAQREERERQRREQEARRQEQVERRAEAVEARHEQQQQQQRQQQQREQQQREQQERQQQQRQQQERQRQHEQQQRQQQQRQQREQQAQQNQAQNTFTLARPLPVDLPDLFGRLDRPMVDRLRRKPTVAELLEIRDHLMQP